MDKLSPSRKERQGGVNNYRFSVDDPSAFTRPFTGEMPFHLTDDMIYEYACHEGNYALPGVLAGAREQEKRAAAGR